MEHHAYLLVGNRETSLSKIDDTDTQSSPDTLIYTFEKFGIDEARMLTNESSMRPVENTHRVFIVSFQTITTEAQNALLKLFEEPNDTTRFYILVEREDILIPTLRSRLMLHTLEQSETVATEASATFLGATYAERLQVIAERMKEKDTEWAELVFRGIEVWAEQNQDLVVQKEIVFVRQYDRTRSASVKMLLEHIALTVPAKTK